MYLIIKAGLFDHVHLLISEGVELVAKGQPRRLVLPGVGLAAAAPILHFLKVTAVLLGTLGRFFPGALGAGVLGRRGQGGEVDLAVEVRGGLVAPAAGQRLPLHGAHGGFAGATHVRRNIRALHHVRRLD